SAGRRASAVDRGDGLQPNGGGGAATADFWLWGGGWLGGGCQMVRTGGGGGDVNGSALAAAAAIELIHTFSLVHDDLSAMDNDDLRRGRPTNHKVYGEALAILAGDAMVTLAFEIIAENSDATIVAKLTKELARAAGPAGMIGGQVLD